MIAFNTYNTNIFAFISVPVFKLLSHKAFSKNKLLKSGLLFKKIANFTSELLQNYK